MSISFSEVPANARVPGMYVEIDNSLANSAEDQQICLVIGNAIEGAAVEPNTVKLCMDESKADKHFSKGNTRSDIARMLKYFRRQDETMPVYAVSVKGGDTMAALAALGDKQYHHIICALNDDTTIRDLGEFLQEQLQRAKSDPRAGLHSQKRQPCRAGDLRLQKQLPVNQLYVRG